MKTAPDGGAIHELPEYMYDYMAELWARQNGVELVSVKKIPKEDKAS